MIEVEIKIQVPDREKLVGDLTALGFSMEDTTRRSYLSQLQERLQ